MILCLEYRRKIELGSIIYKISKYNDKKIYNRKSHEFNTNVRLLAK